MADLDVSDGDPFQLVPYRLLRCQRCGCAEGDRCRARGYVIALFAIGTLREAIATGAVFSYLHQWMGLN